VYQRILLVVEANRSRHVVVDRAVATLALSPTEVQLRVLVLVNSDTTDTLAENEAMYRRLDWFQDLTQPLRLLKLDFDVVVSWSTQFAASIQHAARRFKATVVGVPADDTITAPGLALLRHPPCPVMFIRPGGSPAKRRCILAAVRPVENAAGKEVLNPNVIEIARAAADLHEADLHVIHAGRGASDRDLADLASAAGVPEARMHVDDARPDVAIPKAIESLGADLLVLGSRQRSDAQALRGGVADVLIAQLAIDLLVTP